MESDIGNIKAIREWSRRYFYTKQDINFFMTKLNQGLKGYALMIIGPRNKKVTINPGNYQFTLNSDGWYRYLFFFERNAEITISVQDGETITYQLSEYNDTINLSPYVIATPVMTSKNTPSGYLINAYVNTQDYYWARAFDRNESTNLSTYNGNYNDWISFKFPSGKRIYKAEVSTFCDYGGTPNSFTVNIHLYGSNNNSNWTELSSSHSVIYTVGQSTVHRDVFMIDDPKEYLYYKFTFNHTDYGIKIRDIYYYTVDEA